MPLLDVNDNRHHWYGRIVVSIMTELKVEIEGVDILLKAFVKFPREIARTMSQAGHEAARKEILATEGLGNNYPPETDANRPPTPYYERGRGTVTASGTNYISERLGSKWHVRRIGAQVEIGNTASYAGLVHGDKQRANMKKIGWRKLKTVAAEKIGAVTTIYQAHVTALIRRLGL